MSYGTPRTIRVRWIRLVDDAEVHTTVVDGKTLAAIRRHCDPELYRLEIEPAPDWEQHDRWVELEQRLAGGDDRGETNHQDGPSDVDPR